MGAFDVTFHRHCVDNALAPGQQVLDGTLSDQLTVIEDGHGVADPLHVVEDMGAIEDGCVLTQALHHFQHVAATQWVEGGGGLVEDE